MTNIFTKAAKGASDFLAVVRASGNAPKIITCAADTQPQPDKHGVMQGGLPQGFFSVQFPDGKKWLGYNDTSLGYAFKVPDEFRHPLSKKLIKLNVPRQALPVFRLSMRFAQADGMAKIGGHYVFDTEQQSGQWSGDVEYFKDDAGLWGR